MSVRVKLKKLTTDIIQMSFNHVVPLIQVPYDTQKSKNGLQVRYMYVKKCPNIGYFQHFSTYMYLTCKPFLDFWVSQGTWISGTTWLKPIWIISVVKFLSFTLTDIFLNAFSAKTSIENQHPKTTSNQKKEARSKNNFEKARKRAPWSKVSGTFCKLGRPNGYFKTFLYPAGRISLNLSLKLAARVNRNWGSYHLKIGGLFHTFEYVLSLFPSEPAAIFANLSAFWVGSLKNRRLFLEIWAQFELKTGGPSKYKLSSILTQ